MKRDDFDHQWQPPWEPPWEQQWLLKRNCSLSPRQAGVAYGLLCACVLAIGLAFAWRGVWFVFGFGLLEIGGLGAALVVYARHASDQEHVVLSDQQLLVDRINGAERQQIMLDPRWTRIVVPSRRRTLIALESRGVTVEIGAFVSEHIRRKVAIELREQLHGRSQLA